MPTFRLGRQSVSAEITTKDDRYFLKFGFNADIKDEVYAMEGARWHPDVKQWSVKATQRNDFALGFLQGKSVFSPYTQPLQPFTPHRTTCFKHQIEICSHIITRKRCVIAAEMGSGKTLASIEALEYLVKALTPRPEAWYVGPKVALLSVKLDYAKWGARFYPQFMTFHEAVKRLSNWDSKVAPPQILFIDESSRVKSPESKQAQAMLHLANAMRAHWGDNCYVVLMSGSPAPKSPLDWWMQCEIACPGFIREGDINKFRNRMAIIKKVVGESGVAYPKLLSFKDDVNKCAVCGRYKEHDIHKMDDFAQMTYVAGTSIEDQLHDFAGTKDEVSALYRRLKGIALVVRKKDCLDLPEKVYRVVKLKPTKYANALAKTIRKTAGTAANALNLMRQFSDGFQYVEKLVGTETCEGCKGTKKCTIDNAEVDCIHCGGRGTWKKYETEVVQCDTPKIQALADILEEKEEDGRIVIFASYQGAIDKVIETVVKSKWNFIRRDGRGWYTDLATRDEAQMIQQFQDEKAENRIAFVAHPASAGMGLTLTASDTIVYFSNDFNAESRIQSEDRIHRPGCRGANIIDLVHLPVDQYVLDNLKSKRDMQNVTLGDMSRTMEALEDEFGEVSSN